MAAPARLAPKPVPGRVAGRAGRVALALVSAAVLLGTWYGWSATSVTTANVIDPAAQDTTGPQNILLVGIDTRVDAQGNPLPTNVLNALHAGAAADGADATDTMMLIHIPQGGGRAIGFSIPRDSYVQLAGGYGMHKINSAYTYAETAATNQLHSQGESGAQLAVDAAQAGAKNSIQTVEQFAGVQINHFASVNLVGFYDISQAIGGVQVCLNHATQDSYSGANFPAGVQNVQGAQALAFVRQRHGLPNGDLDREKRQQVFMAAAAHQILSAGVLANPTKLNNLVGAIQKSITLDQGWSVLNFAQQMQSMTSGAIQFVTIPIVNITYPTQSDGDAVEVDPTQVQSFIQQRIASVDNPPAATTTKKAAPPPPTTPTHNNASITAEVYNATGISGLAGEVMKSLTSQGFTGGGTGNATIRRSTVVDYAPGDLASAQQVVSALGGGITTVQNSVLSSGTVRVYVGENYSGPKGATGGTASPSPSTTTSKSPAITAGATQCIN
jgi:LCP family protein required for cell wall assembly